MTRLGIIDIGSNSIKSLVVRTLADGLVVSETEGRSPTRIGTGLSDTPPQIRVEDVASAAAAIRQLMSEAGQCTATGTASANSVCRAEGTDTHTAQAATGAKSKEAAASAAADSSIAPAFHLYATSAIREASNRNAVAATLQEQCGAPLTVLSGEEEAMLIGWAARSMPAFAAIPELLIGDLGGGSLELIHLKNGRIHQACSMHLGAVRLTTEYFGGGHSPVCANSRQALQAHIDALLDASGFDFAAARGALLVGSGGALSALHHMDCFEAQEDHLGTIPLMPVTAMQALYAASCDLDLQTRIKEIGFPKNRADIMPAALLVLLTLAARSDASAYAYCAHNLRFGIAALEIYQARTGTKWTREQPIPAVTIHSDHG